LERTSPAPSPLEEGVGRQNVKANSPMSLSHNHFDTFGGGMLNSRLTERSHTDRTDRTE
jgi:hypothetical protein